MPINSDTIEATDHQSKPEQNEKCSKPGMLEVFFVDEQRNQNLANDNSTRKGLNLITRKRRKSINPSQIPPTSRFSEQSKWIGDKIETSQQHHDNLMHRIRSEAIDVLKNTLKFDLGERNVKELLEQSWRELEPHLNRLLEENFDMAQSKTRWSHLAAKPEVHSANRNKPTTKSRLTDSMFSIEHLKESCHTPSSHSGASGDSSSSKSISPQFSTMEANYVSMVPSSSAKAHYVSSNKKHEGQMEHFVEESDNHATTGLSTLLNRNQLTFSCENKSTLPSNDPSHLLSRIDTELVPNTNNGPNLARHLTNPAECIYGTCVPPPQTIHALMTHLNNVLLNDSNRFIHEQTEALALVVRQSDGDNDGLKDNSYSERLDEPTGKKCTKIDEKVKSMLFSTSVDAQNEGDSFTFTELDNNYKLLNMYERTAENSLSYSTYPGQSNAFYEHLSQNSNNFTNFVYNCLPNLTSINFLSEVPPPARLAITNCVPAEHVKNHVTTLNDSYALADQNSDPMNGLRLTTTLTPVHLRKAKLMFFYTRYPNSTLIKRYFPDVRFYKNNTAQLVKWFSNFREFYYIQIEKHARIAISDGIRSTDEVQVTDDSELYRTLNVHYNRNPNMAVPPQFRLIVEATLREFVRAILAHKDTEQSWKKPIYKIIARLDQPVPDYFRNPNWMEQFLN